MIPVEKGIISHTRNLFINNERDMDKIAFNLRRFKGFEHDIEREVRR